MRVCPNCSAMLPDEARFCTHCGFNPNGAVPPAQPQSFAPNHYSNPTRKPLNIGLIVLVVAVVFGLILAGGILLSGVPPSDSTGLTSDDGNNDGSSTQQLGCGYTCVFESTDMILQGGYSNSLMFKYPVDSYNNQFVIATIKLVNHGTELISTNSNFWLLTDGHGSQWSVSTATYTKTIYKPSVEIGQGGSATFTLLYDIPKTVTQVDIIADQPVTWRNPDYIYQDRSIPLTIDDSIGIPDLKTPAEGSLVNNGGNVLLSWTPVKNAGVYEVRISKMPDFSDDYETIVTSDPSANYFVSLFSMNAEFGILYWEVRAFNGWGRTIGDWSETSSFGVAL